MQINGTLILLYFKELTNRVRYHYLHWQHGWIFDSAGKKHNDNNGQYDEQGNSINM